MKIITTKKLAEMLAKFEGEIQQATHDGVDLKVIHERKRLRYILCNLFVRTSICLHCKRNILVGSLVVQELKVLEHGTDFATVVWEF